MAEGVVVHRKRSVRLLLVAVVLVALLAFGWWSQGDDMGSDAEFERIIAPILPDPPVPVAREDNWYYILMDPSLEGLAPVDPVWSFPDEALKQRAVLAAERIGKKPNFQIPPDRTDGMNSADRVRMTGNAIELRAFARFRSSDWRGGIADTDLMRHIARTYRGGTDLWQWWTADKIELTSLKTLQRALSEGRIPREGALKLSRHLGDDSPSANAREFIQAHRRTIAATSMRDLRLGRERLRQELAWTNKVGPNGEVSLFDFRFQPKADGMIFGRYQRIATAKLYVQMVQAFEEDIADPKPRSLLRSTVIQERAVRQLPAMPIKTPGEQPWMTKAKAMLYRLNIRSKPNAFGLSVCSLADLHIDRTLQTWRAALRILAAISVYRADYGRAPRTLDDLVKTKILPSVPVDPQFGLPFAYDSKTNRLSASGFDGRERDLWWSTKR
ncbi:MAG: hypothetical protein ACOYON_08390 [Fimbriimonas sp.]